MFANHYLILLLVVIIIHCISQKTLQNIYKDMTFRMLICFLIMYKITNNITYSVIISAIFAILLENVSCVEKMGNINFDDIENDIQKFNLDNEKKVFDELNSDPQNLIIKEEGGRNIYINSVAQYLNYINNDILSKIPELSESIIDNLNEQYATIAFKDIERLFGYTKEIETRFKPIRQHPKIRPLLFQINNTKLIKYRDHFNIILSILKKPINKSFSDKVMQHKKIISDIITEI